MLPWRAKNQEAPTNNSCIVLLLLSYHNLTDLSVHSLPASPTTQEKAREDLLSALFRFEGAFVEQGFSVEF
jgi:hypothetical protein